MSTQLTVLQLSTRLSEGGAASVARTLADELPDFNIRTEFAYGYGPHGETSPLENQLHALRVTPKPLVGLNLLSHHLLGRESRFRSPAAWAALRQSVARADVVHLHTVHSYAWDPASLFNLLGDLRKPTVWTFHDQWALTGRCALPGQCELWRHGCKKCPHLDAYPPGTIDRAHKFAPARREMIRALGERAPLQIITCAKWLAQRCADAGFPAATPIPNSVDHAFLEAVRITPRNYQTDTLRILFMCRDLRDRDKVDWRLLDQISRMRHVDLTVMGANAPAPLPHGEVLPPTSDRSELARVMARHDQLLFTSVVDHYPLTVAEALVSGLGVLALASPAMDEFAGFDAVTIAGDAHQLASAIRKSSPPFARQRASVMESFSPQTMTQRYVATYRALMAASA